MNLSTTDLLNYVSNIKFTPSTSLRDMISSHELETVSRIIDGAIPIACMGTADSSLKILNLAASQVKLLTKKAPPSNAVILMILFVMKNVISGDEMTKYNSSEDFFEKYPDFRDRDAGEQSLLRQNANWMHVLFLILPAKKNKGLALDVVPKFVEGFTATYITGSGQTKQTADRVKIYEGEGNVMPSKRYKWKSKSPVQPKRPYKKRETHKISKITAQESKQARCTLRRVAEDLFSGRDDKHFRSHVHFENVSSDSSRHSVMLDSSAPPVPFVRRESSFGRAAAAVASDSDLDPVDLLRNISALSDTSVSAACIDETQPYVVESSYDFEDFVAADQAMFSNYFRPSMCYGEEYCR